MRCSRAALRASPIPSLPPRLLQPYDQIDIHAPFSVAFDAVGLHWARVLVALGALAGILTSLLGSLLGQAHIYVILGRQHLLPPWLVSPQTLKPGW